MKHFENTINYYEDRIAGLRKEITQSIIDLLVSNKLTTVTLTEDADHLSYVIYFDDDGYGYDCVVQTVMLDGDKEIEIEAYSESMGYTVTISSKDDEIGCKNVHWLADILSSTYYSLKEQGYDGK